MGEEKEDEDEDMGQREGKGIIVEEEEEVGAEEEEEYENDEDLEFEEGEVRRPPSRKFHLGVLSRRRLTMPHKKMMKRYVDILLGSSSRGARMELDSLPQAHELSLVMKNVAELSALSGHSLRRSLRMDAIRRRYRKEIRRVRAENDRLNKELTSKKQRLIELETSSLQLKADVVQVTNERQTVEEENKKLKAELEREKVKEKRSRERLVLVHNDLCDKTLKNERLHDALNETTQKLIKWGKEIEDMFPMPSMSKAITFPPVPQISAPEAPLAFDAEELYESQLRLSKADDIIQSLHFEMKNLEDRWISKTKCLEGALERIRATMISYAILEDTSTSSSDKQVEDPSPIVVEDPMSAIIVYEPPPTFEEEDRELVGEFEMSSSEDVDSLFDD
ncbi:hypothetical protein Dimus_024562 [Dionaea muscipula]